MDLAPVRTFGTAALEADGRVWRLEVEPHVAIRLKRVFGKLKQERGVILLSATDENSRELEWFLSRYPVEFAADAREELAQRARRFDRVQETAYRIMAGTYDLPTVNMQLPPRHYQREAAALVLETGRLLLGDELGLGKTVSALTVLASPDTLPAIVVCPVHLQRQWLAEIWRFLRLRAHIVKRTTPYPIADRGRLPDVLVMSYHKLNGWRDTLSDGGWNTIIFDECQELRRPDSAKYSAADHIASTCRYRMGLSATPIYNHGAEFWSVVNVLAPDALGTYHEFVREWCGTDNYRAQDPSKEAIADPRAFGTYVRERGLFLRRTRADVGRELPPITQVVQDVESDPQALDAISSHATELAKIILGQTASDRSEQWRASGEFDWKLRQATGIGKAPYVAAFVRMLLSDGEPVVLYGWHRAVYQIWLEQLGEFKPAIYTGTESPTKKAREAERFIRGDTPLMIVSLRSGAGLDGLQAVCSRAVVGELDWSPGVLEQCIGRVQRDGQTRPVFAYYLVSATGADPYMQDALGLKRQQLEGVHRPDGTFEEFRQVDPNHLKKLAQRFLAGAKR